MGWFHDILNAVHAVYDVVALLENLLAGTQQQNAYQQRVIELLEELLLVFKKEDIDN